MVTSRKSLDLGWKKLGDITEIIMGQSPPSSTYNDKLDGLPFFQGKAEFGARYPEVRKYCSNPVRIAEAKDILMSVRAPVGSLNIADRKSCIGRGLCAIRPSDKIDYLFLFHFLRSIENEISAKGEGSTFTAINRREIERLEIPLPPLPTQRKIVSILERAEKLKNLRQEANDDTNTIIQALFSEMFGDPVKNEKNYTVKPLVEICHRITDGTHVTPKYTEKGIPFLRVTDLTNSNDSKKFISEEEHKELIRRCKPNKGDILYSKNGTIGIAKLINWDYEFSIFVSLCLIKPNKEIILPKYLEIFLNTPFALRQALLHSKKGTITNLHLIEIKKILVPVPSLKEQEAFLKRVEQINNIQNNQTQTTEEISTLFDALMQKAFNGEIVA